MNEQALISGLAHALGSPLQVALSELDFSRQLWAELAPADGGAGSAWEDWSGAHDRAAEAMGRMAALVEVLRRMDRSPDERPTPLRLAGLLQQGSDFVDQLSGPEHTVTLELGSLPDRIIGQEGAWTRGIVGLLMEAAAQAPSVQVEIRQAGDAIEIAVVAAGWQSPLQPAALEALDARPVRAGSGGGCWSVPRCAQAMEGRR